MITLPGSLTLDNIMDSIISQTFDPESALRSSGTGAALDTTAPVALAVSGECGNSVCEVGEDADSCVADCGDVAPPPFSDGTLTAVCEETAPTGANNTIAMPSASPSPGVSASPAPSPGPGGVSASPMPTPSPSSSPSSSAAAAGNSSVPCAFGVDPTTVLEFDASSGDRLPAMVSSGAAGLSASLLMIQTGTMAWKGTTEAGPALVSDPSLMLDPAARYGVAGSSLGGGGAEFGGVGGGVMGYDFGLWDVIDAAQFVVIAGQLHQSGQPWVVKYFVEYFMPSTGLVPVPLAEGFGSSEATRSWKPNSAQALLQPSTWGSGVGPEDLFPFSLVLLCAWSVFVVLLWLVVALLAPRCVSVSATSTADASAVATRRRSSYAGSVPRPPSPWKARGLKLVGFVSRVAVTMYYILTMLAMYELWDSGVEGTIDGAAALLLVVAIALPVVFGFTLASRSATALNFPGSPLRLAFGPLFATFVAPKRFFFLCSPLGERLVSAAIVVLAPRRPILQLFLIFAKQVLVLLAVLYFAPLRHTGVRRFTVAMHVFRTIVLGLSLAFIPSAVSDDKSVVELLGYLVALMHVAMWLSVLAVTFIKVSRACCSRRAAKANKPAAAAGLSMHANPLTAVSSDPESPTVAKVTKAGASPASKAQLVAGAGAGAGAGASAVQHASLPGTASAGTTSAAPTTPRSRVEGNPLFTTFRPKKASKPRTAVKSLVSAVSRADSSSRFSESGERVEFTPTQTRQGLSMYKSRKPATRGRGAAGK